jgi:hypothetical protein
MQMIDQKMKIILSFTPREACQEISILEEQRIYALVRNDIKCQLDTINNINELANQLEGLTNQLEAVQKNIQDRYE